MFVLLGSSLHSEKDGKGAGECFKDFQKYQLRCDLDSRQREAEVC